MNCRRWLFPIVIIAVILGSPLTSAAGHQTSVTIATDVDQLQFSLQNGYDLARLADCQLAGLPGDMCQCPHRGYLLEGRLLMHTPSGEHTYEAGQAFYWAPGHAPEALEDSAYVDFSPTAQLQEVVRHIQNPGN